MKNSPNGLNYRLATTEEKKINKLVDIVIATLKVEAQRGKKGWQKEQSLNDCKDNIKQSNKFATGVPKIEWNQKIVWKNS